MDNFRFLYIDFLRSLRSAYLWVFFSINIALVILTALSNWLLVSQGGVSHESVSKAIVSMPVSTITIFIPAVGIMFISRDFVSGYILRATLLLGDWRRFFFLRAIEAVVLSALFVLAICVLSVLFSSVFLAFAGYPVAKAFSSDLFLSLLSCIPVSSVVGLMAYFLGWALRGAVVFMSVYFPYVFVADPVLSLLIPNFVWFSYPGAVTRATNFFPTTPSEHALSGYTSPYIGFSVVLAYCAVAFLLAYFRNTRRGGIL